MTAAVTGPAVEAAVPAATAVDPLGGPPTRGDQAGKDQAGEDQAGGDQTGGSSGAAAAFEVDGGPEAGEALVGHRAPEIELPDQHGSPFSLTEARSTGPVLIVFFPFAFSGTCTGEMAGLVELHGQLADAGTTLVAVSCDQLFALRVFSDQLGMQFPVLSDFWPHGRLARAYGVFDAERGCAVRGSFLVDRAGTVRWSVVNSIGAGRDLPSHVAAAAALVPDLTT